MSRLKIRGNYTNRLQTDPGSDTSTQIRELLGTIKHKQPHQRAPSLFSQSIGLSSYERELQQVAQVEEKKPILPLLGFKHKQSKLNELKDKERSIILNYIDTGYRVVRGNSLPVTTHKHHKKNQKTLKKKQTIKGRALPKPKRVDRQLNDTFQDSQLDCFRPKADKLNKKATDSRKTDFSLRQEPMKHYVQNKIQRKKREWSQTTPLKMMTYFARVKTQPAQKNVNQLQEVKNNQTITFKGNTIRLPCKDKLPQFIKNYHPKSKQVNILSLIRLKDFTVDYGEDYLYFGQAKQGLRQGKGVELTQNSLFEGSWHENLKNQGYQKAQHGTYLGSFKEGKKHGQGQFRWKNGELYSGQWQLGKKNGLGLWSSPKGDTYMGEWKKGIVEGEGVHKTKNGQRYEGAFKNFLKHGWGKQSFPTGDIFEGMYREGQPHGRGKYKWADGTEYEGDFQFGLRHGRGILITKEGFSYEGDFVMQEAHGSCQISYGKGKFYTGQVKNGLRNGKGTLRLAVEHKVFDGYWKNDEFDDQRLIKQ